MADSIRLARKASVQPSEGYLKLETAVDVHAGKGVARASGQAGSTSIAKVRRLAGEREIAAPFGQDPLDPISR